MTVFAVLLGYSVVSGLLIARYDVTDVHQGWAAEGEGPSAMTLDPVAQPLPPLSALPGIRAALTANRFPKLASIRLHEAGGLVRLELAQADGDRSRMKRFDAYTGAELAEYFPPSTAPNSPKAVRDTIKSYHVGTRFGIPGQVIGLISGLALITMVVSGGLLNWRLWRARTKVGKPALFWKTPSGLWRQFHRWISVIAAVFILNIALTGSILAAGEIKLHFFLEHHMGTPPYPRPGPMPPISDAALLIAPMSAVESAYKAAGAEPIRNIEIVRRVELDKALITLGAVPHIVAIDLASGAPLVAAATSGAQIGNGYFADWHQIVKRMHRGDIIGHFEGRYIDIAAGLSLLYLFLSGLILYIGMLIRRREAGRKGVFWK